MKFITNIKATISEDYEKLNYVESEDIKEVKLRISYTLPRSKKIYFALEDFSSECYYLYIKLIDNEQDKNPLFVKYKISKPFPYCNLNKHANFLNTTKYIGVCYLEICKEDIQIHTRYPFFDRENKWMQGTNIKILKENDEYFLELKTVNVKDSNLQPTLNTTVLIKLPKPFSFYKEDDKSYYLPFASIFLLPFIGYYYKKSRKKIKNLEDEGLKS